LIKVLDKGRKFNAGYCIAEILEPLSQWRSIEAAGNERKLLVHADNPRPHTARSSTPYCDENQMKSAPHPPHSPNLAPSDFYFFGYVKRCLAGLLFEDADQLLAAIEGVLEGDESQRDNLEGEAVSQRHQNFSVLYPRSGMLAWLQRTVKQSDGISGILLSSKLGSSSRWMGSSTSGPLRT
jgi:hypothetical protein